MFKAGPENANIARKLRCSFTKVNSALKDIEANKFKKKEYNSESRFLINNQDGSKIVGFLSFNKFTTPRYGDCKM